MSHIIAGGLLYFVFFGAIGMAIGQRKGRTLAGLTWAMVLGPFGWLLVALLPSAHEAKSARCPHCAGVLAAGSAQCGHCRNRVTWIRGRAVKPSRLAE